MESSSSLPSAEIYFKEFRFEDLVEIPIEEWKLDEREKTKSVADEVLTFATLSLYKFHYSIANLRKKSSPEDIASVFKYSKNLTYVHNYAKKKELHKYIKSTIKAEDFKEIGEQFGLYPKLDEVKVAPVDNGKCFGALAYFFLKVFETDIKTAIKEFEGGLPFEAALFQSVYSNFTLEKYNPEMTEILKLIIDLYPRVPNKENFWKNSEKLWKLKLSDSSLPIFHEVKKFLAEGKDPTKENLLDVIQNNLKNREKSLSLGAAYGAIRKAAEYYLNKSISVHDVSRLGFALGGLDLEVLEDECDPETILKTIDGLKPGKYAFSYVFPSGESHIVGFVIENDSSAYFFDPNLAIGTMKKEELRPTIENDLLAYDIKISGEKMAKKGCSLYQITKHKHPL